MVDIAKIKKDYEDILNQLSDPELISNWDKFEELNKEKVKLEKFIEKTKIIEDFKNQIEENKAILKSQDDSELSSLAEAEISQLQKKQKITEKELENLATEERETSGPKAIIMEIRAGTGGDEAALFVADMYKMYSKYAATKGWKLNVLDSNSTGIGGFKEMILEINGVNVWQSMQYEGGVHRVQRIPTTEKQGRVHTSTISVAVLPKPKSTQIKINPADLKMEVAKATGPGGQNVNKRMTAVRIVHLPTGIAVESRAQRNLQQNKENALSILSARLFEKREMEQLESLGEKRKAQIGQAKRAEKIRTYNFPQDRITDHRIKKNFHNLEGVMEGKLNDIIDALVNSET